MTGALCVPVIWMFASSYSGIEGDARIYMARALADLDPAGTGRDLMFALDGQSDFTIFRILAAKLVNISNPGAAALWLAVVNIAVWFAAMTYLVTRFVRGRAAGLLMVCAGVLPCPYGFFPLMSSREIIAVPRPLAEACVLAALAALCEGRVAWAVAGLGVAALLHPIMALPGFGVLILVQGWRDRRWFWAAALALAAITAAASLGLPLFARLTAVIDTPWRDVLTQRNPYLFVSHWPLRSFAPLAAQAATVAIAGLLMAGRQRGLLLAILTVAGLGVATSVVLCDALSLLLPTQVQSWRALWLVSVIAMPAFGLCLLELPKRGVLGQIALALLVLAWLTFDTLPLTPAAAASALALFFASGRSRPVVSRAFVPLAWVVLMAVAASFKAADVQFAWSYVRSLPAIKSDVFGAFWRAGVLPWPFVGLAFVWARWPRLSAQTAAACCLLAALNLVLVTSWDARTAVARRMETAVRDPALMALTAARPGEVLWLARDEEWYWLGRPQWNTFTQGAGIVFSRPLAMQWLERTKFLISLGLIGEEKLRPWRNAPSIGIAHLTPAAINTVCARADAPAWIIAPLPAGMPVPPGAVPWQAPAPQAVYNVEGEHIHWHVFDTYAAVACGA